MDSQRWDQARPIIALATRRSLAEQAKRLIEKADRTPPGARTRRNFAEGSDCCYIRPAASFAVFRMETSPMPRLQKLINERAFLTYERMLFRREPDIFSSICTELYENFKAIELLKRELAS
ncbi:hypothetical protein [Bradyrhizobium sp. SZCCHNR2009]|uniref:hypothetical protein n=1 Tax=Bradyrhizobium sp. SZCCHNR2009 TaxID=3057375 RepID=UPI0028EEC353|nr:hypothetical protein [Bradyrhizobium sp. SZCCHNR2009]